MSLKETLEKLDSTETRFAPPVEIKLAGADGDTGQFHGYASTWDGPPDAFGDVVKRGAFAASLREHAEAGTMPPLLWSHAPDMPVGRILDLREDARGLAVKGQLNLSSNSGRQAYEHVRAGDVSGLSIGFLTRKREGVTLLDVHLAEISLVSMPANVRAQILGVKGFTRRDVKAVLAGEGMPRRAVDKLLARGWGGISGDEVTEDAVVAMLTESRARWKQKD